MATQPKATEKVCHHCKLDVAQLPRVKDAKGRYFCKPCYTTATQQSPKPKPTSTATRPNNPPASTRSGALTKPSPKPVKAETAPPPELDEFMDGFDPDAEVIAAPSHAEVAKVNRCGGCNGPLAPGAVICVVCGTNAKSGKKLKGAGTNSAVTGAASKAAKALGNYAQGVIFGAIGAAIGAAIWCGIAVATGVELGYVAWALGGLAGFGMQLGYGDANPKAGLTAIGLALAGIGASKISIVYFMLKKLHPEATIPVGDLVSFEVIKLTMDHPLDFVFVALAVLTAYRLGTHGLSFEE